MWGRQILQQVQVGHTDLVTRTSVWDVLDTVHHTIIKRQWTYLPVKFLRMCQVIVSPYLICVVQCFNLRMTKGLYFILFITQSDWIIWINLSHLNNTQPHWLSLYEHRNISFFFLQQNSNVVYTSLAKFCAKTLRKFWQRSQTKKMSIISIYSNTTHTTSRSKQAAFCY